MLHFIAFFLSALVLFVWLLLAGFRTGTPQYYGWALLVLVLLVRAIRQRIKRSTRNPF